MEKEVKKLRDERGNKRVERKGSNKRVEGKVVISGWKER